MTEQKPGQLHPSWQAVIGDVFNKPYMQTSRTFLQQKSYRQIVYSSKLTIALKLNTPIL